MGANLVTRKNAAGKITCYQVRYDQYIDGRRVRRGPTFDPTAAGKSAAKRFLADVLANGKPSRAEAPEAVDVLSVKRLVERYLEDRAKSKKIKSDRTVADYSRDARLHIYPALGHRPVDELTTDDVQEWLDLLETHNRHGEPTGNPVSAKTALNVHGLLSSAYKLGVKQRTVTRGNPCEGTELPPRTQGVVRGLRAGEWQLVYQAAVDTDPLAADFLLFLVCTGWRWSEATALQVLELELDRDVPTAQVGRVFRRTADNSVQLVEGDAKSNAGLRRVKLPEIAADMLRRRVDGMDLGDYVFQTAKGHPLHYRNFRVRLWKPTLALAAKRGLQAKPTIHWLRHTHVAQLLEVEPNLAAVQKHVGHADITTTTRVYGSLIDDVSDAAIEHLNAALSGKTLGRPKLRAVSD